MIRILLVDDELVVRSLMAEILAEAGYDVVEAASAESALERLADPTIALVVSDIVMPGLSGIELLEETRRKQPSLPVVLVTGAGTHAHLTQALAQGAAGLVLKPFTHAELQHAVASTLTRAEHAERDLRERLLTPTLAGALANAIEARDADMHGHCERLAALAVRLAVELALSPGEVETVRLGALLHDIGKIGIPDRVLLKPAPLDAEERELMETHPLIGDRLLAPVDLLRGAREVVRHHHERWDGLGYPDRLAGEDIPLAARIVAVADAVEAMSATRRYRPRLDIAPIVREVRGGRAKQWDPRVVDVVVTLIESGELRFAERGLVVTEASVGAASPGERPAVLLVEGDHERAARTKTALERELDAVVSHAPDTESAQNLCRSSAWSLVVLDGGLPDGAGLALLGALRRTSPEVPVLVLTRGGSGEATLAAVRHGAADYVEASGSYVKELTRRVRVLLEAA